MHNTAVQKFNFLNSWALQNYMQKWPVFMCNLIKKTDLNFVFMQNFMKKNLFILNECGISYKKVISCKTMQLLRKRIDCFVETLI